MEKAGGGEPMLRGKGVELPKRQRLGGLADTESIQRNLKHSTVPQAVLTNNSETFIRKIILNASTTPKCLPRILAGYEPIAIGNQRA